MCFITYSVCNICKEDTFNEPCICSNVSLCSKFIFFQRENELCDSCFYDINGHPNMLRFKRRGYQLRNRFIPVY